MIFGFYTLTILALFFSFLAIGSRSNFISFAWLLAVNFCVANVFLLFNNYLIFIFVVMFLVFLLSIIFIFFFSIVGVEFLPMNKINLKRAFLLIFVGLAFIVEYILFLLYNPKLRSVVTNKTVSKLVDDNKSFLLELSGDIFGYHSYLIILIFIFSIIAMIGVNYTLHIIEKQDKSIKGKEE